jgi:CheY-like chemotaxis protein
MARRFFIRERLAFGPDLEFRADLNDRAVRLDGCPARSRKKRGPGERRDAGLSGAGARRGGVEIHAKAKYLRQCCTDVPPTECQPRLPLNWAAVRICSRALWLLLQAAFPGPRQRGRRSRAARPCRSCRHGPPHHLRGGLTEHLGRRIQSFRKHGGHRKRALLLDSKMWPISGAEFLQRLQARPDASDFPAMLVTADRDQQSTRNASGVLALLPNPFDVLAPTALLDEFF